MPNAAMLGYIPLISVYFRKEEMLGMMFIQILHLGYKVRAFFYEKFWKPQVSTIALKGTLEVCDFITT